MSRRFLGRSSWAQAAPSMLVVACLVVACGGDDADTRVGDAGNPGGRADGGSFPGGDGGPDGGSEPDLFDQLVAKYRECGYLTAGDFEPVERYLGVYGRCFASCTLARSCAQLVEVSCFGGESCEDACAFTCADGDVRFGGDRCNARVDCDDGSDEVGCAPGDGAFMCADGSAVVNEARCNGERECADGSDETGCQTCDGDAEFPERFFDVRHVCDGEERCFDTSDEPSTCARFDPPDCG